MHRDDENVSRLGLLARTHQHGRKRSRTYITYWRSLRRPSSQPVLAIKILKTRRAPSGQTDTYTCVRACVLTLIPECAFWHGHIGWVQHLPEITTPELATKKGSRNCLLMLSLKHANTANPEEILVHVRPRLHARELDNMVMRKMWHTHGMMMRQRCG